MTSRRSALLRTLAGLAGIEIAGREAFAQSPGGATDGRANVRDFGARGVGSTDDTGAIQRAIDSLRRGGVVYLPAGTYRITRTLRISVDGVAIEGAGGHTAG